MPDTGTEQPKADDAASQAETTPPPSTEPMPAIVLDKGLPQPEPVGVSEATTSSPDSSNSGNPPPIETSAPATNPDSEVSAASALDSVGTPDALSATPEVKPDPMATSGDVKVPAEGGVGGTTSLDNEVDPQLDKIPTVKSMPADEPPVFGATPQVESKWGIPGTVLPPPVENQSGISIKPTTSLEDHRTIVQRGVDVAKGLLHIGGHSSAAAVDTGPSTSSGTLPTATPETPKV